MITRHLDTLLHAIDLCEEAGPSVVSALPAGRIQLAVARLLAAAADVSEALDWRLEGERDADQAGIGAGSSLNA